MPIQVYENGAWREAAGPAAAIAAHEAEADPHPQLLQRSGARTSQGRLTVRSPGDRAIDMARNGAAMIRFEQTNVAGAGKNYWIRHDAVGDFYLLMDKTGDGGWNSPHPMVIPQSGGGEVSFGLPFRTTTAGQYYGYVLDTNTATPAVSSTTMTNMYSFSIPANTMIANSRMSLISVLTTSSIDTHSYFIETTYNGVAIGRPTAWSSSTSGQTDIILHVDCVQHSTTAFRMYAKIQRQHNDSSVNKEVGWVDGTNDVATATTFSTRARASTGTVTLTHRFSQIVFWK